MRISSSDITVNINYPEQYEWDEKIQSTIAKWILDRQIENYGHENVRVSYKTWISCEEIESKKQAAKRPKPPLPRPASAS